MAGKNEKSSDDPQLSIDARNVHLTYSDGTEAVRGISLRIPRGEFFGFLGPNGAGKTTFIKILVTLLTPTEGKVSVNGFNLGRESQAIRETIGYMDQETRVDKELTARQYPICLRSLRCSTEKARETDRRTTRTCRTIGSGRQKSRGFLGGDEETPRCSNSPSPRTSSAVLR